MLGSSGDVVAVVVFVVSKGSVSMLLYRREEKSDPRRREPNTYWSFPTSLELWSQLYRFEVGWFFPVSLLPVVSTRPEQQQTSKKASLVPSLTACAGCAAKSSDEDCVCSFCCSLLLFVLDRADDADPVKVPCSNVALMIGLSPSLLSSIHSGIPKDSNPSFHQELDGTVH